MTQQDFRIDPQSWKADLPVFQEATRRFYAGDASVKEYKGISGGFGSYAQKGGKASMLRLRTPGGRLNREKLAFVARCVRQYGVDKLHFTTCQTIQLHDLQPDVLFAIMEEALDVGIVTRGGGGDFPRNAMVSPLSGVEPGEYFDVMPWAEAASEYLMTFIKAQKMPRKLKVGFSNGPANLPHVTFRDLGFAARPDGTFDVYSAGGLGLNPKLGLKVSEAVPPCEILFHIRAMWELFLAHGNYENRAKARTRYMQDTLGAEGYMAAYRETLAKVKAEHPELVLEVSPAPIPKTGDGSSAAGRRILAQKQEGLYAVHYHPLGGCPAPEQMAALSDLLSGMPGAELRLAPDESAYIVNLTGQEAMAVAELTADSARDLFETSVACIGASICQQGVGDSQKLLRDCVEAVRAAHLKDGALPQIHISGCPSSCGTHQIGVIGFHGGVKVIDKAPTPAFTLHLYGSDRQGQERFGKQVGMLLARDIPSFLVRLGRTVEASGLDFDAWCAANPGAMETIAADFLV